MRNKELLKLMLSIRVRAICEIMRSIFERDLARIRSFNAIYGDCNHLRTRSLGSVCRNVALVGRRTFDTQGFLVTVLISYMVSKAFKQYSVNKPKHGL